MHLSGWEDAKEIFAEHRDASLLELLLKFPAKEKCRTLLRDPYFRGVFSGITLKQLNASHDLRIIDRMSSISNSEVACLEQYQKFIDWICTAGGFEESKPKKTAKIDSLHSALVAKFAEVELSDFSWALMISRPLYDSRWPKNIWDVSVADLTRNFLESPMSSSALKESKQFAELDGIIVELTDAYFKRIARFDPVIVATLRTLLRNRYALRREAVESVSALVKKASPMTRADFPAVDRNQPLSSTVDFLLSKLPSHQNDAFAKVCCSVTTKPRTSASIGKRGNGVVDKTELRKAQHLARKAEDKLRLYWRRLELDRTYQTVIYDMLRSANGGKLFLHVDDASAFLTKLDPALKSALAIHFCRLEYALDRACTKVRNGWYLTPEERGEVDNA